MAFSPKKVLVNYGAAVLLAVFLFFSNFLNTNLFDFGQLNFAVWFVLSIFSFSSGWFINRILGWQRGGKIVFAIIIAITIVSLFIIIFFNEYFSASQLITENIILYSLRNIMPVSYTHLRAHETVLDLVCRLLLEKKTIPIYIN